MTIRNFLFNADVATRSRLPWVDYTKGIAIILVIYRHIWYGLSRDHMDTWHYPYLKYANDIVYSFRMPLFFVLSGVFIGRSLAKRSVGRFIKNKFNTLLYPYLVWAVLQITLQILSTRFTNSHRGLIDYSYILLQPRKIDQLWYLISLFNVTILYMCFKALIKLPKPWQLLLGLIFYWLATYVQQWSLIHDALYYYFFYAVGDNISEKTLNLGNVKHYSSLILLSILVPLFILSQTFFLQHPMDFGISRPNGINIGNHLVYYYLFIIITIIGCAFLTNISFILQRFAALKFLRVVGYHSLYIYVIHLSLMFIIRMLFTRVLHITNVPIMLFSSLFIGIPISIMLYNTILRLGGWFLFTYEPDKKAMSLFSSHSSVVNQVENH